MRSPRSARSIVARARDRLLGALALYLAEPIQPGATGSGTDPHRLAAMLCRGDVRSVGHAVIADPNLVPSDFERASIFEIVGPAHASEAV